MSKKGKLIVFEGLDGSGKTTQLKNLEKKLTERGFNCKAEKEPSDGVIGRVIRDALTGRITFQSETLALLFAADRYEHITGELIPALNEGYYVLCDRYVFSNLAYQGAELPFKKIAEYNSRAMDMLMPDLTIFIDADPEICFKRLKQSRLELELFEDLDKSIIIRENFLKTFELLKKRAEVKVVDGNGSENEVFERILSAVSCLIK